MKTISSQKFKYTLKDIHKNTENRKFCFVIGAGASRKSGIPTGGELAQTWFEEIQERHTKEELEGWIKENKIDRQDLASHYGTIYRKRFESDKTSGYEFLVQAMRKAKPSVGHIVLAQILSRISGHCVLTTNFDSLIESSIYQFTNKTPLVCGHESLSGYARPSNIHPLIIKVHRDLLLAPKSDPDEINKLDAGWNEPLDNIFSTHIPIIIGYGGNDGSLMSYFEQMKKPSNFFWCGLSEDSLSKRVINLMDKIDGQFVKIAGFDEFMHELLWVFDEIKPIKEELSEITKSRIEIATKQLSEITKNKMEVAREELDEPSKADDNEVITKSSVRKELSALEYANLAENENNLEKRKSIYVEALKHYPKTAWLWNEFTYFLHFVKKDYSDLDRYYQEALAVDSENANNNGNYALYLHNIKKDYENAERYYLKALTLEPNIANFNGSYAIYLMDIKKDYGLAEKYYSAALSIDPENVNWNNIYGNYLKDIKKDYENAEKFYLNALSIDPENANSNGNYAIYLKDIKKDYENAEKYYQKSLSIDPENVGTNGNYAIYLKDIKKDYENAEKLYLKSLTIDPENADLNGNFAQLLLSTNRKDEATQYLEKAFKFNAGNKKDLLIELWFYRYAHYPEFLDEAENIIEGLLKEGIRSIGWNLEDNVRVAIENKHPYPDKLKDFAKRITERVEN